MTEFAIRSSQDLNRLYGALHAIDLTKPKVVVIKDEKRPDAVSYTHLTLPTN